MGTVSDGKKLCFLIEHPLSAAQFSQKIHDHEKQGFNAKRAILGNSFHKILWQAGSFAAARPPFITITVAAWAISNYLLTKRVIVHIKYELIMLSEQFWMNFFLLCFYSMIHRTIVQNKIISIISSCLFFVRRIFIGLVLGWVCLTKNLARVGLTKNQFSGSIFLSEEKKKHSTQNCMQYNEWYDVRFSILIFIYF